jgi:hypothetical protein
LETAIFRWPRPMREFVGVSVFGCPA